ncbi:dephospho-CoA kinase [Luteolibacter ambystomatis]|uniref:Dephospho-CoA kinase n=1 Tax=Luteolibacter ambystomatis TaxID=2824561 RepID=A0A975G6E8_9BACT|nr:dephospho-CoA kinase [Luteolibacter ambystomatis]QUE49626.1 dephospho-CoA kinase [Luteolibacter ambystomatis]
MRTFALTGGIATGKSTFCRLLEEEMPGARIFDCDASVRGLLAADAGVAAEVRGLFGDDAVDVEGCVDRAFLRQRVFADPAARLALEGVLHPRVREECLASRAAAAKEGQVLFVADVPLLFEKGFDFGQERSLLVAVTRATQILRLKARNGFDDALMEAILAAQLPIEEKMRRADIVFWNEGPPEVLRSQIRRFSLSIP